ncbi:MAG: site-specific integrase, partial [Halobacteriales archaeon]|nr:site-specific integrase [Halobacteriales archaeon]
LEDVTKADVTAYVLDARRIRIWRNRDGTGKETITRREVMLGPATLAQRKVVIKCFYKWLRGGDDYPPEVRWLKTKRREEDQLPVDALVTPDDLARLLQACPGYREKALIAALYESGFRAGELCALNVGSVTFGQHGCYLTLPKKAAGLKTGARRILLFEGTSYVQAWFEHHPFKDDPSKPFFHSLSRRAPMARMTPGALWSFIQDTARRAGIKKPLHPHLFRHSAATERARERWTEGEMRSFFGWARNSDMPSRYVHLAGQDYERMELQRRGLLDAADRSRPALRGRTCRRCKAENILTATFCQNCRQPVSPNAEAVIKAERDAEFKVVAAKLLEDEIKQRVAAEVERFLAAAPVGHPG